MKRKIIIIGGVAGGASAAARIRRLNAEAEIIMFERGEHVSFSNCGLPYYLSGTVAKSENLILMTPEGFKKQHNIDVFVNQEVLSIHPDEKYVVVKNLLSGQERKESYDKVILSPGANPVRPKSIKGVDGENVFTVRNVSDIVSIKEYIDHHKIKNIAVVGGGFIGLEIAENLKMADLNVHLIEGLDQIMAPFDDDLVQILHKELMDHDVDLHLSSTVTAIDHESVYFTKNETTQQVSAEAVILAIGVAPETKLAKEAGLAIGVTGGIKVNHNYQTSNPDIYAVGDTIESFHSLLHTSGRLALAGPAQRQARAAADHIYGKSIANKGFIGSSCIRLFSQNAACTGINEKTAKANQIPCEFAYIFPNDKVNIMPQSNYMAFKLLFEVPTGRILGAQAIGKGNVDKRIDVIASMITMNATLEDLKDLELCYSPVFGTAKDVVNMAALVGLNILENRYKQVPVSEVRPLVESGAYIIDVREKREYAAGHVKGAVNIPLSELKERAEEIPKDVPVYLHCRSSQRSYYAVSYLINIGFTNIKNICGSFLGISLYEYFNDKDQGREPIVTKYIFN